MSIKTELKAKLQKTKEDQKKEERDIQAEARKFIEEFIIPKFREISDEKATDEYLWIEFHSNIGCWNYTSNIDDWDHRKYSNYSYKVVSEAVKLAKKFEIYASKSDDGAGGTDLKFWLNLD